MTKQEERKSGRGENLTTVRSTVPKRSEDTQYISINGIDNWMNSVITSLEVRIEDLGLDGLFEELHKQKRECWY